jgi:hypothetical protein
MALFSRVRRDPDGLVEALLKEFGPGRLAEIHRLIGDVLKGQAS